MRSSYIEILKRLSLLGRQWPVWYSDSQHKTTVHGLPTINFKWFDITCVTFGHDLNVYRFTYTIKKYM